MIKKINIFNRYRIYNLLVNLSPNLPSRVKIPYFTGEKIVFCKKVIPALIYQYNSVSTPYENKKKIIKSLMRCGYLFVSDQVYDFGQKLIRPRLLGNYKKTSVYLNLFIIKEKENWTKEL